MTQEELAIQAWILVGNAVGEILRGLPATPTALRRNVEALEERLEDIPADGILAGIAELPPHDRDLLLAVCEKCVDILGGDCQERVGLSCEEAQTVLAHLRAI